MKQKCGRRQNNCLDLPVAPRDKTSEKANERACVPGERAKDARHDYQLVADPLQYSLQPGAPHQGGRESTPP
jgi:hypothetical protein